jgi:hypothetical protein
MSIVPVAILSSQVGMGYREQLIRLVEAYAAAKNRKEATIANLAGRDGRFFQRLREGRGCSVDTLNHLLQWFSDRWPDELPWPEEVHRPSPNFAPAPEQAA